MIKKYGYKGLVWVDLISPTPTEVAETIREYNLHTLVGDELLSPTMKPKVDVYDDCIYLILHFPNRRSSHLTETRKNEIDFVIGKHFIITAHYDSIETLDTFSKIFEVNSILDKGTIGEHAGYIFFYMIKKLYKTMDLDLEYIRNSVAAAEDKIFKGEERKMVEVLSNLGRELLDFRQVIKAHKDVWDSFEVAGGKFYGNHFNYHIKSIIAEYYKTASTIDANRDFLKELRETNDSLLSTKQNDTMKLFTVLAFVTFPLALAIDIITIPSASNPLAGHPNAFWIILIGTFVACVIMFAFFKYKKWI